MTTYAEARFKGETDVEYHHSHRYQLRIKQRWNGALTVAVTHGYDFKPVKDMVRIYPTLEDFFREWTVVRILQPGG